MKPLTKVVCGAFVAMMCAPLYIGAVEVSRDKTAVQSLSAIPVEVVTSGVLTVARVKDFGGLDRTSSPFTSANAEAVESLIYRRCSITTQVIGKPDRSLAHRWYSEDAAWFSCDGQEAPVKVPGYLVSESGSPGMGKLEAGVRAYFLVQSAEAI